VNNKLNLLIFWVNYHFKYACVYARLELTSKSQIFCSFPLKGALRLKSWKIQGKAADPLGGMENGCDELERYREGDRRE